MTKNFNAEYVKAHRQNVHSYDSFSRALVENVLMETEKLLDKNQSQNPVKIPVEFSVSPIEAKGCVEVCANIGGVKICHHVNL